MSRRDQNKLVVYGHSGEGHHSKESSALIKYSSEDKVVLFRPGSNDAEVYLRHNRPSIDVVSQCPLCGSLVDSNSLPEHGIHGHAQSHGRSQRGGGEPVFFAPDYFQCLTGGTGYTGGSGDDSQFEQSDGQLPKSAFNQGYYDRFFSEIGPLGRGGYGSVYLCEHVLDGVVLGQFAVKKVPVGDNESWLMRKLSEVFTLQRLQHPNVIGYKHTWLETSQPSRFGPEVPCLYILMEYAEGGTLASYIQDLKRQAARGPQSTQSPLTIAETFLMFADICRGLAHLHHLSVVHRDIKPENLFIRRSRDGQTDVDIRLEVVLGDFGQAMDASELTSRNTLPTGTLEYMAPELFTPDVSGTFSTQTTKSDMWSLGMVLHYMLFGHLPWPAFDRPSRTAGRTDQSEGTMLAEAVQGYNAEFDLPRSCDDGVEGVLHELRALLLSQDPQLRPSIDDVLSELHSIAPIAPPSPSKPASSSPKRRASVVAAVTDMGPDTDLQLPPAALQLSPRRRASTARVQRHSLPLLTYRGTAVEEESSPSVAKSIPVNRERAHRLRSSHGDSSGGRVWNTLELLLLLAASHFSTRHDTTLSAIVFAVSLVVCEVIVALVGRDVLSLAVARLLMAGNLSLVGFYRVPKEYMLPAVIVGMLAGTWTMSSLRKKGVTNKA